MSLLLRVGWLPSVVLDTGWLPSVVLGVEWLPSVVQYTGRLASVALNVGWLLSAVLDVGELLSVVVDIVMFRFAALDVGRILLFVLASGRDPRILLYAEELCSVALGVGSRSPLISFHLSLVLSFRTDICEDFDSSVQRLKKTELENQGYIYTDSQHSLLRLAVV